eukprot:CAMPEP_0204089994 /NCGR_PEP_ID=MMETSP0360-20130528/188579_1 /ASSEMBLY_ACC=CAM_ASM_000342 /TAXON_ID=268821 /ORGANISM="Scrippsiella Hangoei, Strain SHTV-5" /LENGTH=72 /DNA_ID=CAMNT_0051039247 /DNA_START=30 /DNA_END=248 /DNA_ORIENTATION=-
MNASELAAGTTCSGSAPRATTFNLIHWFSSDLAKKGTNPTRAKATSPPAKNSAEVPSAGGASDSACFFLESM